MALTDAGSILNKRPLCELCDMSKSISFAVVAAVMLLSGCSHWKGGTASHEKKTEQDWQNPSYQRDNSLLKAGVDKQARDIEERLGVNRGTDVFQ